MAIITEGAETISLDGGRKSRGNLTKARIRWVIVALVLVLGTVGGRLIQLGATVTDSTIEGVARDVITASRPPILDRNGLEMAVDIRVPSLFAEPRRIIDVEEAVQKLRTVLPDLNEDWLRKRLTGDKGFVWVKRELTPAIRDRIFQLGVPGLDFVTESKRFYPSGQEASHILGAVNIDNQGTMGIEKHMDDDSLAMLQSIGLARGNEMTPVSLSVDLRVQHVMYEQLQDALVRYKAVAAAGVMLDIKTGEVIALASLPDFDPNNPSTLFQDYNGVKNDRFNRITSGIYELGSTFKTITLAGALDSGKVRITDKFDARFGVRFGRFTIDDFHGKHRVLSLPEVYKYSSNIGTIKIMQQLGKDDFRAFLSKIGMDKPVPFELPEMRKPKVPEKFSEIVAATSSFGHGLSVSPLHMARAVAAFVNDGYMVPPTMYKRSEAEARQLYEPVISPATSAEVRYLMRLNAIGAGGSGSRMNKIANGYRAGGKTGTAEKVVNGRYSSNVNFNVFASAFPLDNPRYAMVIIVDEPKAENAQSGVTAGWNAGEVSGRIIQRAAPMLGISPDFSAMLDTNLVPPELR
ncbi:MULTISPECIES: penicillin-binding protein 2 [unclassified Devosia]|jgi:cell division protein FtsI (penicillin-binding protein 3)|uniref:peptidoglycan D,D-transpeptidase FtsI family protein n=1 Tax=unclassified Devosia TaxID=196773 RepID=UPI00086A85C0|nr:MULTISPECIES: penicillin-binding protein 2 [unclassified Devosia]MBN9363788.1 penicillin-binding protein 2 [Devosia sp.]ODS94762.1 MAG: cell division protein [Devosia sp. SCN 66-27]OJX27075.1 MAG: cell division protein [Devosia sp. 66-14]